MNELKDIIAQWNRLEDAIVEISFQIYQQGEDPGGNIVSEFLYAASQMFQQRQSDIIHTSKKYVFTKDRTPFPVLIDCTADQFTSSSYELYAYQPYDDSTRLIETLEEFYKTEDGELIVEDTLPHLMFLYKKFETLWEELGDITIDEDEEIEQPFYRFPIGTPREHIWHDFEFYHGVSIGKYMDGEDPYS